MKLFIQGMRRSGTTIVYDALLEDPGLHCLYEPFSHARAAPGGGSGVRQDDLFAEVRALREEFRRTRWPGGDTELLNWGAPREPELELDGDLPDFCRDYLRFLLDQAPDVVVKEVRMYGKLPVLAEVAPQARLLHLVRDPRAVATSYLMGRGRKRAELFPDADAFFERRSKRSMWASRPLSEALMRRPEFEHLRGCSDIERVLLVWRFTWEQTRAGAGAFAERYGLLRHEGLGADPVAAMTSVYELMGRELPAEVARWARAHISERMEVFAPQDARWGVALQTVGLGPALEQAGYGSPVDGG